MRDISSFSRATGAYQDALRAANSILEKMGSAAASGPSETSKGESFFDMVGSALTGAANTGYKSENLSMKAIAGKADLTDVITAVSEAETALNTVVAIRDKVIGAYLDIIKMPI